MMVRLEEKTSRPCTDAFVFNALQYLVIRGSTKNPHKMKCGLARFLPPNPIGLRRTILLLALVLCLSFYFMSSSRKSPLDRKTDDIQVLETGNNFLQQYQSEISKEFRGTSKEIPPQPCQEDLGRKLSATLVGRIGNELFIYSSLYGLSRSTCRMPSVACEKPCIIKRLFSQIKIPFTYKGEAKTTLQEGTFGIYNSSLAVAIREDAESHVYLMKYMQSYKYFNMYEKELREQFKFTKKVKNLSKAFIAEVRSKFTMSEKMSVSYNTGNNSRSRDVTMVGVHVRRGDLLEKQNIKSGYLTADVTYFQRAMDYFRKKYENVHFLVATDDIQWVSANLNDTDVTFTMKKMMADFATLAQCDHVIMSVGTFGWWAGWLAGGEVTYKYPTFERGSLMDKRLRREDFFPPNWIGIQG